MKNAVIGMGTNIGNRLENLNNAVEAINLLPNTKVIKISDFYETDPIGYLEQDKFMNACIFLETELSPHALLGACLGIEAGFHRVRTIKNGPRILDLDLLFYENEIIDTPDLILPHPRIKERAFVLVPLQDLELSSAICPYNICEILKEIGTDGVNKAITDSKEAVL